MAAREKSALNELKIREAHIDGLNLSLIISLCLELQTALNQTESELETAREEHKVLIETLQSMEMKIQHLETRHVQMTHKTQEQIKEAQDAIMDRTRCELKEKQLQNEIDRLQDRLKRTAERQQEILVTETTMYIKIRMTYF
jgi:hypothetical protein